MALQQAFFRVFSIFIICFKLKLSEGAVFFPTNSAFGIFAAIAVPLDLPHRNVFLSYNFEANYNLPNQWNLPPVALGIEDDDDFLGRKCANCTIDENAARGATDEDATLAPDEATDESTTEENEETTAAPTEKPKAKRAASPAEGSLLSRRHFYHILMDKFQRSGFNGEPCLLRLICETNASELGDINGILGNLIHIIFSPSTSMYEELPLAYYQAEIDGAHEQCGHYISVCKENLLDVISKPLVDIVGAMMPNK